MNIDDMTCQINQKVALKSFVFAFISIPIFQFIDLFLIGVGVEGSPL